MNPIELQREHDQAIRAHGQEAFPQECCGFLLGRDEAGVRRIVEVAAAVNLRGERELHNRFTISPEAFMAAEKRARASRLEILGFYHSHPDASALPSPYDLEHAWPVYSYIIVSVRNGEPQQMTCWVLDDDRGRFDEQRITVAEQLGGPTKESD